MKKKISLILPSFLLSMLLFVGCSSEANEKYATAKPIMTPAVINEATPTQTPVVTAKPTPTQAAAQANTKSSNSRTVYYVPSGKSYHYSEGCSTLARSKTILSQTLEEALRSSHNDPCDKCVN